MLLVFLVQVICQQSNPHRESRGFGVKSRLTGNPKVIPGPTPKQVLRQDYVRFADDTPGGERRRFPERRLEVSSTVWQLSVHVDFGFARDSASDIVQRMRTLVWTLLCFVISTIGCQAQRPEDQVLAVYSQMEKAVQSGDANTFIGLWSRGSASEAEKMGSQLHPQPDVHYTSSKVFVQGDEAALLGQYGKDGFLSMRFVKEDRRWKIKDFAFSDKAYPAESVYAIIPPAAGAFERAGAPWQNVAPAFDKADAAKHGFQVRATYDESFLYIRIESSTPIPAPGSQAEKPPMGWPVTAGITAVKSSMPFPSGNGQRKWTTAPFPDIGKGIC